MANTTKEASHLDANLTERYAFNDTTRTLGVSGFISAKVGHKITLTISTTNVANDTETYEYFDDLVSIMQLEIIYTSGTRETMLSVERIA